MAQEFQLLPGPLGFSEAYISDRPQVLIMKQQFGITGQDYTVKNAEEEDVVKVNAKFGSITTEKEFFSSNKEHLFSVHKKVFSSPGFWYVQGPNEEKLMSLEGLASWGAPFGKAKMEITVKNVLGGGEEVKLGVEGETHEHKADVTWNGVLIARVQRNMENVQRLVGYHVYGVEVAPGVDLAMMAATVIAIDEQTTFRLLGWGLPATLLSVAL